MNTLISTSGLIGLFLISIISFSILPGPSDIATFAGIALGFSPTKVILVASLGAIIGRAINYYLGSLGESYIVKKKKWLKKKSSHKI